MKKVVWIVNEYNFPDAENTRQTNFCRLLNERGYDAYIISGSADHKGEANHISSNKNYVYIETDEAKGFIIKTGNYKRSYERVLVSLQFQLKLWSLRKKLPKPDIIISEFAGLFGNVFLRWKKKYGTKVVYDILDLWPQGFVDMGFLKASSPITKWLYHLEHKSYKNADGLLFSFEGGKDYICDRGWSKDTGGDVDTSRIGYINNGTNIEAVDQQKNQFVFEDSDLDSKKFKVVYLGSISAFNGLDVIIETAKCLQEQKNDKVQFLIYGYGNQEERLKKLAVDYKLNNLIFKGKVDKRYAMNILSRSDINVFTFAKTGLLKYGTSPNKLFMYFASGKPVLSLIKPSYDLVEGRKCGISVDNNVSDIVSAIDRFSKMDEKAYSDFCINSRKTAEEFDYKNQIDQLINIIEGK